MGKVMDLRELQTESWTHGPDVAWTDVEQVTAEMVHQKWERDSEPAPASDPQPEGGVPPREELETEPETPVDEGAE